MRVFNYKCTECETVEEKFVKSWDVTEEICTDCGGVSKKIPTAVNYLYVAGGNDGYVNVPYTGPRSKANMAGSAHLFKRKSDKGQSQISVPKMPKKSDP